MQCSCGEVTGGSPKIRGRVDTLQGVTGRWLISCAVSEDDTKQESKAPHSDWLNVLLFLEMLNYFGIKTLPHTEQVLGKLCGWPLLCSLCVWCVVCVCVICLQGTTQLMQFSAFIVMFPTDEIVHKQTHNSHHAQISS